ncbi:MAG: MBL fold metallo-hydrolase [Nanoarchaeota archaeon]|nr:MBL fold metallo-hydrolase [Nanoarchaeota archaeon]
MQISVLGSGSKGNSIFLKAGDTRLLFDMGLSCMQTRKRLENIGEDLNSIDAVFISHEHSDHIKGLETLQRQYSIPVLLTKETYEATRFKLFKAHFFRHDQKLHLNGVTIQPIKTSHDSRDSCGFFITSKKSRFGIFTDLGFVSDPIAGVLGKLDGVAIETNHDIDMLLNGSYPYSLKQRIMGNSGHLSNIDAALAVKEQASRRLKKVFLAHLSDNNNTPELAMNTFRKITSKNISLSFDTIMTDQDRETDLIRI